MRTTALWGVAVVAVVAWASSAAAQPLGNHYLCHKVKDLKQPAKFAAVTAVTVVDAVGNFTCDAKKPFYLCNPASKNGSPVIDPDLAYCCYKSKCNPKKVKVSFDITDQFGGLRLQTKKPFLICNPCSEVLVP
jgi:hypothetical protein